MFFSYWSERRGSNSQLPCPKHGRLPLTYFPITYPLLSFKSRIVLVLRGGFEPTYLPLIRQMHVPYVLAQMVQRRRIELPLRDYRSRLLTIVGPLYILVVRFRVELKSTVFQTARLTTLRTLP